MQTSANIEEIVQEAEATTLLERNKQAIALLRAWREEGDADEQRETGTFLLQALADNPVVIEKHNE